MRSIRICSLGTAFLLGVLGCSSSAPEGGPLPPPMVTVGVPVEKEVTDFNDFSGRTMAVESVLVRTRVWGYLQKINFEEGTLVNKNDVLFEIDPRPYQEMLNQAKAKVAQDEAQLAFDDGEYQRNLNLVGTGGVSRSDLDKSAAARSVDIANVAADKAMVASRQLDLGFTKVRAPIRGVVGRALVTAGNLVQSGETGGTLLTTLVSVDPMYAYFDVDDQTSAPIKLLVPCGKYKTAPETLPPVHLGLASETGFPHAGVIDFVDNQVDPSTGTLKMRGVFPNKNRALTPGMFVRVRVPLGKAHKALLITDRAVDTDQGQKVVYVVDADNVVEKRDVQLGRLHDGLREILSGLKPGERVIVDGIQRVRGGVVVNPSSGDKETAPDKETRR